MEQRPAQVQFGAARVVQSSGGLFFWHRIICCFRKTRTHGGWADPTRAVNFAQHIETMARIACHQRVPNKEPAFHTLLKLCWKHDLGIFYCPDMSSNSINGWNLRKDDFDALMRNESARDNDLEQALDQEIRRRFGELIASASGRQDDFGARPIGRLPANERENRE